MSDRMAAEITIGGNITQQQLAGLYAAAVADGVGFDYGETLGSREEFDETVAALGDSPISLKDDQASGGSLDELEKFCHANNLVYRRYTEGKYEYDAEIVSWMSGMKEPRVTTSDQSGGVLIDVAEIIRVLKENVSSSQKLLHIVRLVKDAMPVDVPPLKVVAAAAEGSVDGQAAS